MKMILHNLKVAFRNLMKYKLQTAISVLSIAVGIVTLSFTHSLISRFRLPFICNETYYDRAYQLKFISINDVQAVQITNDIIRAVKKDGGPRCVEKIAVPNGSPLSINAEFHLSDSTIRKGNIDGMIIDPVYADYAGMRSAITGKKIRRLKAGEAIISEDFAKHIFQDKNPIGAVQTATKNSQPIPVTIVDVYRSLSVSDSPIDNDNLYYCLADDISDRDFDNSDYFAVWINVVLKKDFTISQLEKEINGRIKPFELKAHIEKISDRDNLRIFIAIQLIGYIIGALILLAAIIGFLRIEIQLFRIRRRELSLRIVNGANFIRLFGLLFTEIIVVVLVSVVISMILGVLLQDFCDTKLNLIVNNIGIDFSNLWVYSLVIGSGLIAVCCFIVWLIVSRICKTGNVLAENMRRSRSHVFRNIMLGIQTVICMIFVCCTFILVNGGNKILKVCNVPANDADFKEYLYFEPMYCVEKDRIVNEIKRLPDLDKIILCGQSYTSVNEIRESSDAMEKLDRHIYFHTYFTDDVTLLSELGMDVEWFKGNIDHNNCMLISDKLYNRLQELGILRNNSLTIEASRNKDVTFPIAGTIKSIAYDMENESLVFILPNWEENQFMQYVLIPKSGKGASLARNVDETVKHIEPELINKVVSNYRERISPLSGFLEAVRVGGWILGCVSLLICAMSIFSTVALDTRARRKEVAVRKVNGAKSRNIYRMFGQVYVMLIVISFIVAIPICVLFNQVVESLVKDISSGITLSSFWPIVLGVSVVTILIFAIVGWQIYRVMQVNPAKIIAKE